MPARPGNISKGPEYTAEVAVSLRRSLEAAREKGTQLSELLLGEDCVWQAALVAGATHSLGTALHLIDHVTRQLTGEVPKGAKDAIREHQEQDAQIEGQMRLV